MSNNIILLPFVNRYKSYRILNYGLPYTNYQTYNIRYNPKNTTNIFAITMTRVPNVFTNFVFSTNNLNVV